MVEGFLFNWINTKATGTAIAVQYNFAMFAAAHITQPPLSLTHLTKARAQVTLHPPIFQTVPIFGRV